MDLGGWLRSLGLERYEAAFRENEIDETVLPNLTAEDLKDLGVGIVGHRRKILDAIAALRVEESAKTPSAAVTAKTDATPEDRAERRQVTVMFSDLVGSTALSARMDPEDLREVISAYQKCVTETVGRFGGSWRSIWGDGVLVYFGYPQAHEDDADRAVRAGLGLVAAVSAIKTSVLLQTRVARTYRHDLRSLRWTVRRLCLGFLRRRQGGRADGRPSFVAPHIPSNNRSYVRSISNG
jgi:SAM domain (Sterile alpha motif)/Adenylate and Guanylate cyclase catalytic domain